MTCIQAVPDQLDEFDADQVAQFLCDPTLTVPQSILLPDAALAATVDFHPHQARIWLEWTNCFGEATFRQNVFCQQKVVDTVARCCL